MDKIREQVPLAPYTTFRVGGIAQYFSDIYHQEEIPPLVAHAQKHDTPIHILGGGSNTIFTDGILNKHVFCMKESYIRIRHTDKSSIYIEIGAGTHWDEVVAWAVTHQYAGIEALSAIPGTTGAAPIQNIGAYGQEIKDTLVEICAYDTHAHTFISITNKQCKFGYRTSIFKECARGRYIITSIVIQLSIHNVTAPTYPDIKEYFEKQNIHTPTPSQIRSAVQEIRFKKIPDPQKIPNAGSFFKNPIITQSQAQRLQKNYPTLKLFPVNRDLVKIPAGWLIEQCNLKGTTIGPIGIYEKNALILTNTGSATYQDIIYAKDSIQKKVFETFQITLEMEPDCIIEKHSQSSLFLKL